MGAPERPDNPDQPPPFGPDDHSELDARQLEGQLASARTALQSVQHKLTQMRYRPGPDKRVAEVREITRVDGQWPFLLIRSYPGDVGKRPVTPSDVAPNWWIGTSPDIIVTEPGPPDRPKIVDRGPDMDALKSREQAVLRIGWTYDVWVHVWNLGQGPASGVRVRVRRQGASDDNVPGAPSAEFLGGAVLDLGDRLSERAHRLVKATTFTLPTVDAQFYGDFDYFRGFLVATVDTLSDPSSGNLTLGADRHTAYRFIYADHGPA